MSLLIALAFTNVLATEPIDLSLLTGAIDRCDRKVALPMFAAEQQRRSAAVVAFYQEQAQITSERIELAARRRALREETFPSTPTTEGPPEVQLTLQQLSLDDRQRALDDRRRLEGLRQQAIDMSRQYFLARCAGQQETQ